MLGDGRSDRALGSDGRRRAADRPPHRRHSGRAAAQGADEDGRHHDHQGREPAGARRSGRTATVGWGEAPSAPTMTGDTLGGLVAAVRDHLAPLLIGKDARARSSRDAAARAGRQHRRAFGGRDGAARSCRPRGQHAADRSGRRGRCARASRRCGCSAMRRPSRTSPRRRRSRREGFNFFKLKIGVKPIARRDRGRARDPRGAARRDALRRRQLRADARGRAALCRAHARREARCSSSSRCPPTISPA